MDLDNPWQTDPAFIRAEFEKQMIDPQMVVTSRVGKYLVPALEREARKYKEGGKSAQAWALAANHCSMILAGAKDVVAQDISERIKNMPEKVEASGFRDSAIQAIISNAGKMFERFTAYAASRALSDTNWVVWKDKADIRRILGMPKKQFLGLKRLIMGEDIEIELEADYIAMHVPNVDAYPIVLLNCKTSLKERLHQATMWAMLRQMALRGHSGLRPNSPEMLARCRYCLVTGDFAKKQHDLKGPRAPRKLIRFDFSFFDEVFAAVTREWNATLADSYDFESKQLVHRMSAFRSYLQSLKPI